MINSEEPNPEPSRSAMESDIYTETQKKTAMIFYIAIVISCIMTIAGLVYTIADFIMTEGKLTLFLSLNIGYQIAIVGGLFAGLFLIVILFLGLYKKGTQVILKIIFKKIVVEEKYRHRKDVQIGAGGLLLSVIAIILGLAISIIYEVLIGSSDATSPTIANLLSTFSQGQVLLFISIIVFSFVGLCIFMLYFWNNGYYLILKLIGGLEEEKK
ncbi:MAG: hypothetical protein ACTSUN_04270 [Promethearchaeota archaeon]